MSTATFHNASIDQGSLFELNILAQNSDKSIMDLTGYDARMQVRETVESVTVLLAASTGDGRITINAPGGVVMIRIGADITSALTFNTARYDVEVYKAGDLTTVKRLVEGNISLHPEVTR
jgi:hypothetical protein